jgi:hypothetical protein
MKPDQAGMTPEHGTAALPVRSDSDLSLNATGRTLFHPRVLALLAGLVSGLLAFGLGEALHDWFAPKLVPQMLSGAEVMRPTHQTLATAAARNGAVAFALLGGPGVLSGASRRPGPPVGPPRLRRGAVGPDPGISHGSSPATRLDRAILPASTVAVLR